MKGLELAKKYYMQFGAPMIDQQFPKLASVIAVGLVGSGSECYGFDDEISLDHDFEPGFCLFVPDESVIDRQTAFALERAYAKLPHEFMGYTRQTIQPVGGSRHGVIRIADFYKDKIGYTDGPRTLYDWFTIPEYALAEATNGEVFRDDSGIFSGIREKLLHIPLDVRKKKLAGHLLLMAQSGQYNYTRCLQHKETAAAQLALYEFVEHVTSAMFLLNQKFAPFYKWRFRALRNLNQTTKMADDLEFLISSPNNEANADKKQKIITDIVNVVVNELRKQQLSTIPDTELTLHAYDLNRSISDSHLRNEHILFGV